MHQHYHPVSVTIKHLTAKVTADSGARETVMRLQGRLNKWGVTHPRHDRQHTPDMICNSKIYNKNGSHSFKIKCKNQI